MYCFTLNKTITYTLVRTFNWNYVSSLYYVHSNLSKLLKGQFMCLFYLFSGNKDITLIQMSFDGNNATSPPNLMNEDIFERIKIKVRWDFASFINIIYSNDYNFEAGVTNKIAAEKLRAVSNKKWFFYQNLFMYQS